MKKKLRKKEKNTRKDREIDLAKIISETAVRLRSGDSSEIAWRKTLERAGVRNGVLDEAGVPEILRILWKEENCPFWHRTVQRIRNYLRGESSRVTRRNSRMKARVGIPAAVAVCRMSKVSGAPQAEVLESCAQGITEVVEGISERKVALAGPKTTAWMLACMPLLGMILGAVIGARPLSFLTQTPLGFAVLIAGGAMEFLGLLWVRALVKKAERDT